MVCLRNICINTLHKGDDDDNNDDNNNNNDYNCVVFVCSDRNVDEFESSGVTSYRLVTNYQSFQVESLSLDCLVTQHSILSPNAPHAFHARE